MHRINGTFPVPKPKHLKWRFYSQEKSAATKVLVTGKIAE